MKSSWPFVLLFIAAVGYGQTPQPTPFPPFQLNVRVVYPGEKERPDYAAFIYKALREIPNVALAEENPDAILMITETGSGKQYACTFVILRPATRDVKMYVKAAMAAAPPSDNGGDPFWSVALRNSIHDLKPMYYWGNTWTVINESPKAALAASIKLFDVRFVEKERRADEDARRYLRDHPMPAFASPTPRPALELTAPPEGTPFLLLGPDLFPTKR